MLQIMRYASLLSCLAIIAVFAIASPSRGAGYTIYYESKLDDDVAIFRYDSAGPVVATPAGCISPSITSDGSMLFYSRKAVTNWGTFWNVFYMKNGDEYKLTRNEIYDEWDPMVSRDGTFATFTSRRQENLEIITYPMDEDDLAYRITESPKPDEEPALSGDGEWVYWTGRTGNHSYIFRAPGRGGATERISADSSAWEEHPSISADGRYMAYVSIDRSVMVAETESGESEEPVETDVPKGGKPPHKYPGYGGGGDTNPEPEPETPEEEEEDSRAQAEDVEIFEAEGNSDIWVLDLRTSERTRLTSETSWDGNPCISSDGQVIVFTSDRDGNYEIYMINRDGTGLHRLTENDVVDDNATIT